MASDGWLSKTEVNSLYYAGVGGDIVFATEAQAGLHSGAVARLLRLAARDAGKDSVRVLELGANNGTFARALLRDLTGLGGWGPPLARVDYLAVEYSERALDAAVAAEFTQSPTSRILQPRESTEASGDGEPRLLALVSRGARPVVHLGLVHAEAGRFLRANTERFDLVIVNELLDDLSCRGFYSDGRGVPHELEVAALQEGELWRIRARSRRLVGEEGEFLTGMPRSTVTTTSTEAVELVGGVQQALVPGGVLVVHDYGFSVPFPRLSTYEPLPRALPPFARLEFPLGSDRGFPRSLHRVFGNETHRLVQITTDVNFVELADRLAPHGRVVTLPHGNAMANREGFGGFNRGDGVFLSEFGLLEPSDRLEDLVVQLDEMQASYRQRYLHRYCGGREAVFHDLVFVNGAGAAPTDT